MLSAIREFRFRFHGEPTVFRAPGRVNLIGEHTDYNDGFVMPVALELATYVAVGPRDDTELRVFSIDFDEQRTQSLDAVKPTSPGHWSDYVYGVCATLAARGVELRGANLVISGGVPMGAGLSSSAAIEVATAFALLHNSHRELDRKQIALACQQAEHEYAGTRCGIMDQFISCLGQAGNALLIDCRSLEHRLLPLREEYKIAICDTGAKHEHASGEYNRRRSECEEAVAYLKAQLPKIASLRDVSLPQLNEFGRGMSEVLLRRARHVITENERVLHAAEALSNGDNDRFGALMFASHRSLRDDYEVSCEELDVMVSLAQTIEGVVGARMTGGGFGGCTVNLLRRDAVSQFQSEITVRYKSATGISARIYIGNAADGAGQVLGERGT